ncbi:hypothetical protein D3C74_109620 [compost metagenome]
MIVLYSWLCIIGAIGLIIGFILTIVRVAKKRKVIPRNSGFFMLGCLAVVILGTVGALSSVSNPPVNAKTSSFDATPDDENLIQVSSEKLEGSGIDQESDSKDSKLLSEALMQKTIEEYIFENFGGSGDEKFSASWYRSIESVQLKPEGDQGYIITVNTTLFHDNEGKEYAEKIPPAFFGWANGNENVDNSPIWAVTVYDQNGKPLIREENPINPLLNVE